MGLEHFTPISGFFGGGLIGLSAGLLLLFSGEILGSSGIASSVVLQPKKHLTDPLVAWKLVFLSAFLLFSNVCLAKYYTDDERLGTDPSIPVVSTWGYILGGLFVGFGTRLGNGCTTGHGICGMARLSKRSITAVCTFMFSAFAVSAVISPDNRTLASGTEWLRTDVVPVFFNRWLGFGCSFLFIIPTCVALYNLLQKENSRRSSLVVLKRQASIHFPKAKISDILDETKEGSSFADDSKALKTTDYSTMTLEKTKSIEETDHEEDLESGATCPNPVSSKVGSVSGDEDTKIQEDAVEKKWSELRNQLKATQKKLSDGKILPAALAACVFALGLAISQMVLPSKVLGFLALYTMSTSTEGSYDPTLLTVMVGGSIVSFLSYQFVDGWGIIKNPWAKATPLSSSEFCVPKNNVIDWQLLVGAFCFGVGWALAGLCPGPATFLAASGTKPVLAYWWPLYFVGAFAAQKLKDRTASS